MKKRIVSFLLALLMLASLVPNAALPASAASRSTSEKAIAVLKEIEGFHAKAYQDNGQWSIGYGTAASEGDTIIEEEADKALRTALKTIDKAVSTLSITARREFTQNEHDALALFSYNCGTAWVTANGRFRQSIINDEIGNEFLYNICLWANSGGEPSKGLLNRRLAEANMYLNGVYDADPPENFTYVLLDANGGSVGEDKMQGYNTNVPVEIKAIPTKSGSRFLGWYTKAEGGDYITVLNKSTAGDTLYAHWQTEGAGVENGTVVGTPASYTLSASKAASLKVYETPDTSAKVIKTLTKTVTMYIVAEYVDTANIKWVQLKDGGWVSLGDVEEPVTALENVSVTVTGDSVNVRENAGAYSYNKVVRRVTQGEKLTISRITTVSGSKWGLCEYGWIALMYTDYDQVIQESESTSDTVIATGTVVCSSILKVRSGAGTIYKQVGTIATGTRVAIYDIKEYRGSKWGRISAGWICLDYVELDSDKKEDETEKDEDTTSETVVATGTVTHTYVNYRSGAGTTYTCKGQLSKGAKLSFFEIKTVNGHDWGRFKDGWVCLDYVTLDKQPVVDKEDTTDKENTPDKEENPDKEDTSTDKENTTTGKDETTETKNYLLAVTSAQVEVYDSNGKKTDQVIKQGRAVKVYALGTFQGQTDVMAQVEEGYVLAKYLTIALDSEKFVTTAKVTVYSTAGGVASGKTLEKGTQVTATKMKITDDAVWVYIWEAGGWVNAELLTAVEPDEEEPEATTPEETEPEETQPEETEPEETKPDDKEEDKDDNKEESAGYQTGVIYGADVVNVRSSAGVRYDNLVTTVKRGTQVKVYETVTKDDAQWGRIDQGWICMKYVNLNASTSGGSSSGSTATGYATGFVHSDINLNVRTGPGTTYPKVTSLAPGTEVRIYEQELNKGMIWGRIDQGWVCMSYVTMMSTGGSTGDTGSTEGSVMGTIARCFYAVNVRSAPGTGNALVGKILVGSRVEIYEQRQYGSTMWGRVDQGWISMDYVLLDSELPPADGNTGSTGGTTTTPEETKPSTPSDALYTGTVRGTNSLNVRSAASTKASQSGTMKRGDSVVIYETAIADYMAWGRTDQGWICLVYVDLVPCTSGAIDARVVQAFDAVIRSGAGTKYEKVGTYEKATVVNIYETSGNWARTDKGWVSLNDLLG
ncbi:MAG: SH3 domain-containing protein [Oscillospiraceae bacterium]|nr:SH3 domain-containing protein [Oscillospiraceae bacterium]